MKRTAKPKSRFSASTSWRISRWTTTSSAVVGSSRMMSSGLSASAIAMMTRWRMPPDSSCGYARTRRLSMPTSSSSSPARTMRAVLRDPLVRLHHVDELVADAHDGIQRVHRALEDHRDVPPAIAAQLFAALQDEVLVPEQDAAADDVRRRAQDLHDRVRDGALPATRLAGEPEDLPRADLEIDAVDGTDAPVLDDELPHVEERLRRGHLRRRLLGKRRHAWAFGRASHRPPIRTASLLCFSIFSVRRRGLLTSSMPARMSTRPRTVQPSARLREDERPPLALEHGRVHLRPVHGDAPARRRHVAEAEELEPGVDEERDVEDEHERCRDPADHVRHQLAEHDPRRRLTGGLRRQDEVAALEREGLTAEDARLERPEDEREDDRHRTHALCLEVDGDDDEERDRRDGEEDIREQVDELVDDAAGIRGGDAENGRDERRERAGHRTEQKRAASADDDLREHVASLVGRPEQVVPRRCLLRCEQVEVVRMGDRDERGDDRDDDDEGNQDEADARLRVAQEEREPAGDPDAPPADTACVAGRYADVEDSGIDLRHQLVRSRGSRTKLRRSMTRLATITQTESTTRIACASG